LLKRRAIGMLSEEERRKAEAFIAKKIEGTTSTMRSYEPMYVGEHVILLSKKPAHYSDNGGRHYCPAEVVLCELRAPRGSGKVLNTGRYTRKRYDEMMAAAKAADGEFEQVLKVEAEQEARYQAAVEEAEAQIEAEARELEGLIPGRKAKIERCYYDGKEMYICRISYSKNGVRIGADVYLEIGTREKKYEYWAHAGKDANREKFFEALKKGME